MAKVARMQWQGGEYPFLSIDGMSYRELAVFKHVAGLGAAEIAEALSHVDVEAVTAMLIVSAKRLGVTIKPDDVLDAAPGSLQVLAPEGEPEPEHGDDADPPASSALATPDELSSEPQPQLTAASAASGTPR